MQISVARCVLRNMALVLSVAALAGCSAFSNDNPHYDPVPLTEYTAGVSVKEAWSVSIGSGSAFGFIPVVVGDSAYAAAPSGSVIKVDLASGQVQWKGDAKIDLSAGVGSDGTITAVAGPDGTVVAFDDKGIEKWRAKASSEVDVPPVVGGGVVAVRSSDYRIQAFNENTGEPIWNIQRPGPALALKTSMQMIIVQGILISGLPNGRIMAINAGNGSVQWEGTVSNSLGATDLERISDVVGTPQLQGPLLCGVAYQGRISCFDISQGGRPIWNKTFSSNTGMTSDAQQVYLPNQHDEVYSYSLADGHQIWVQSGLRNRRLTAPAVVAQGVAVGDFEGYVHFLSRIDGHLLGRLQVGGDAILSPLVASDHGVLVQTGNANLVLVGVN
jgi:outer membrane protein assembly factor BamB